MREAALQKKVLEFQDLVELENNIKDKIEKQVELKTIQSKKDVLYQTIENEYGLQVRMKSWYDSYQGMFDTWDDFWGVCRGIFYEAILDYKTLQQRIDENTARYEKGEIKKKDIQPKGNGELNTFFAYMLRNTMINYYNASQAQQRNPIVCCPICHQYVSPFKKHLKEDHEEYFRNAWREHWSRDVEDFEKCPICGKSVKKMYAHIVSRHPDIIFDLFHKEFSDHVISEKNYSLDYKYDDGDSDEKHATLHDILYNNGEDEIIDEISYKKSLEDIWKVINEDERLFLAHVLTGRKRREVCDKLNWDAKKYLRVRTSLKAKSEIQDILNL